MPVTKARIEKNLSRIRENIAAAAARAGRDEREISLVAVTKSAEVPAIRALLELGVADLGESRAQQLEERSAELADALRRRRGEPLPAPRWHMVGHLQRNKVRSILAAADVIHSVDSLRLAEEINARGEQLDRTIDVLLQVNCSEEAQKFGVAVGASTHLAELMSTLRNLRLLGLMTMAPLTSDPERARRAFVRLRELFEEICTSRVGGPSFRHLSMGMSQDYAVAVEEGATLLRIGTALFE